MFKTVLTLFRGSVAAAGEELEDRSALLILDQQMRDAAAAVERSKRTLALAIAGDQQEGRRLDATNARIADLEVRATAALDGGREDLAREAAQAIANLEADRDAAMTARTLFASEITRMKRQVANAEARITELDRGRRIARASEAVRALRRGGIEAARPYESTLPEAENTLKRLRERQIEAQAAVRRPDRTRCRHRTAGDRREARRTGLWPSAEINRGRRARAAERQTHASCLKLNLID